MIICPKKDTWLAVQPVHLADRLTFRHTPAEEVRKAGQTERYHPNGRIFRAIPYVPSRWLVSRSEPFFPVLLCRVCRLQRRLVPDLPKYLDKRDGLPVCKVPWAPIDAPANQKGSGLSMN